VTVAAETDGVFYRPCRRWHVVSRPGYRLSATILKTVADVKAPEAGTIMFVRAHAVLRRETDSHRCVVGSKIGVSKEAICQLTPAVLVTTDWVAQQPTDTGVRVVEVDVDTRLFAPRKVGL
jgi:hypothetical protein